MGMCLNLAMRENDGRKLDHATLEALRIRAVEQVEAGEHPEDPSWLTLVFTGSALDGVEGLRGGRWVGVVRR